MAENKGHFKPGHARLGGRRKGKGKGKGNRYNRDIREALLAAGEELGGKRGLTGFFLDLGRKDPRMLGTWIAALLPRQVKVDGDGQSNGTTVTAIHIHGVASGTFLGKEDYERSLYGAPLAMIGDATVIEATEREFEADPSTDRPCESDDPPFSAADDRATRATDFPPPAQRPEFGSSTGT